MSIITKRELQQRTEQNLGKIELMSKCICMRKLAMFKRQTSLTSAVNSKGNGEGYAILLEIINTSQVKSS